VLELPQYALLSTALGTALFHTLIPDHWLPFVLIGRARNWSVAYTVIVSGFSAVVHVVFSLLLGLLALTLGRVSAEAIGETLEHSSHILLIVFGLVYAIWSWRKGGHFHPGGSMLHRHEHGDACAGDEGDANPEHLHYHADTDLIRGGTDLRAFGLAFIVGANPCLLLMPLLLESTRYGSGPVLLVTLAYSVPTVLLMVGLSAIGVSGLVRIRVPGIARHMEMLSGLLIALLGLLLWLTGH